MNLEQTLAALVGMTDFTKDVIAIAYDVYGKWHVHMASGAFVRQYDKYETRKLDERYDRVWVMVDGIEVFALVDQQDPTTT